MKSRSAIAAIGLTVSSLVLVAFSAAPAQAATTCTWGGTPNAATGTFTLDPGLTNLPAPTALKFKATGELAGDDPICSGTLTFVGQADAGSTCLLTSFEGQVKGLPGVTSFWGKGNVMAPDLLYNAAGEVVGSDQPQVLTQENFPKATDCASSTGFTDANFSSTVELF
jgi:hypothetical protein